MQTNSLQALSKLNHKKTQTNGQSQRTQLKQNPKSNCNTINTKKNSNQITKNHQNLVQIKHKQTTQTRQPQNTN